MSWLLGGEALAPILTPTFAQFGPTAKEKPADGQCPDGEEKNGFSSCQHFGSPSIPALIITTMTTKNLDVHQSLSEPGSRSDGSDNAVRMRHSHTQRTPCSITISHRHITESTNFRNLYTAPEGVALVRQVAVIELVKQVVDTRID